MADDWRTPDTEALVEAILRLETAKRPPVPARPVHPGRAARPRPAVGRRPAPRRRHALRRDLPAHGRKHGDHHPDRVLAEPRRGRLPGHAGPPEGERWHDALPDRGRAMRERLRLAVPNKGRLVEPTLACCTMRASCSRNTTGASWPASRTPTLDILFVRTNDVIEFVADGVADAGITGVRHPRRVRGRAPRSCGTSAMGAAAWRPPSPRTRRTSRSPTSAAFGSRRRTPTSRGGSSRSRASPST